MTLSAGDLILNKEFRILESLGHGQFGDVYRALDAQLNVERAVKTLRADAPGVGSTVFGQIRERFRQEAQLGARLDHPNVIKVYRFSEDEANQALYMVMELADGVVVGGQRARSLREVLVIRGPMPVDEMVRILLDACAGLSALHDKPLFVVHRDVKPSNILLDEKGRAKIADLGVAQVPGARRTGDTRLSGSSAPPHPGTKEYCSPEHRTGDQLLLPTADVYSLGCVAFEMLTGELWKNFQHKARGPRDLRGDVPVWLDGIVARMLARVPGETLDDAKDASRRYVDCGVVGEALKRAAGKTGAPLAFLRFMPARQKREAEAIERMAADAAAQQRVAEDAARLEREEEERQRAAAAQKLVAEDAARQKREAEKVERVAAQKRLADDVARQKREEEERQRAAAAQKLVAEDAARQKREEEERQRAAAAQKRVAEEAARLKREEEERQRAVAAAEVKRKAEANQRLRRVSADRIALVLAPGVEMEFVRVPAGEFLMGSNRAKDKLAFDDEVPLHRLTLPEYWIGKTPVTVAQFAEYLRATGANTSARSDLANKGAHPVFGVSWDDCVEFGGWACKLGGGQVTLPSEAEWEKAARGTDGRLYPWGNQIPDNTRLNCDGSSIGTTSPVGQYGAKGQSPYGCDDMAGNVWEWTRSMYKSYPYALSALREDLAGRDGRVLRGGSFYSGARYARCAYRGWGNPDIHLGNSGFRVILCRPSFA